MIIIRGWLLKMPTWRLPYLTSSFEDFFPIDWSYIRIHVTNVLGLKIENRIYREKKLLRILTPLCPFAYFSESIYSLVYFLMLKSLYLGILVEFSSFLTVLNHFFFLAKVVIQLVLPLKPIESTYNYLSITVLEPKQLYFVF